ncbi:MAG: DNA polymerase III subunit delta' [Proteobacteria bacterium SW_6_67_9]|nr:MAG: DNA polymerase III subunit delta' [Proteobacteria bacterium SW_6_67_9]
MTADAVHPWQRGQWSRLTRDRAAQRLPHALLIAGPTGTGLRAFAETLGQALLCPADPDDAPCGACRGCRLYAAGTHPDALRIEPAETGKAISVDAVRALTERLSLTGSGTAKVALIDPAESLTAAAANGLLKTLEEPAGGAHVVLISRRVARLPATIRSRCQRVSFGLPDAELAVQWLESHGVESPPQWLARAGGAPILAREYAHSANETAAQAATVVDRLLTVLENAAATIEDLLRLRYAPARAPLRWPEQRTRMQALVPALDGPALFDYLDAVYRSMPGASSSLRPDTQYLGPLVDAAALGAATTKRSRG